jgi:shikimate dehydrogenase
MQNTAFREQNLSYTYCLKPVPSSSLGTAVNSLREDTVLGANVTIPHKKDILVYLDQVSKEAIDIGAVNTIVKNKDALIGENTDASGGLKALEEEYSDLENARVIVIGAGGASRALSYGLAQKVSKLTILNRTQGKAEELATYLSEKIVSKVESGGLDDLKKSIEEADILINATSLGMKPNMERSPVPSEYLHDGLLVYDLVYNPMETKLLREAKMRGARVLSGVKMLVYQGALSYEMWTGYKPPVKLMLKVVQEALGGNSR